MSGVLRIALTGVGGFGARHVAAAETLEREGLVKLVAFAEPNTTLPTVADLVTRGIHGYADFFEMMEQEKELDLVCIASPTWLHARMAEEAFKRGIHVFLEKPPCLRIQDFRKLVSRQQETGCLCMVGFHDIARPAVTALKQRLCEGVIGRIIQIHACTRWKRTRSYYTRNQWAGKCFLNGETVLDGPVNNSNAHVLNLASFFAGQSLRSFARPAWVQGELYRAAPIIEGEDTTCLRAEMENQVSVVIHLTQAAARQHPRVCHIFGEKGVAIFHDEKGVFIGSEHIPHLPQDNATCDLMRELVRTIQRGNNNALSMPLRAAEGFMLLSNGAYESAGAIVPIPGQYVTVQKKGDDEEYVLNDIDSTMMAAALEGKLLSEWGVPWAENSHPFDLTDYSAFSWSPPL